MENSKPFKTMAFIHSLKDMKTDQNHPAEATIISHVDNNNVTAEYNGVLYRAIFNPFVCAYYVDDIYGRVEKSEGEAHG